MSDPPPPADPQPEALPTDEAMPVEAAPPALGADQKACSECGQPILAVAIKCKHCKRFVDGAREPGRGDSGRLVEVADPLVACVACAEQISPRARRCRYCKAEQAPATEPERRGSGALFKVLAVIGLLLVGMAALTIPAVLYGMKWIKGATLDEQAAAAEQRGDELGAARFYGEAGDAWSDLGSFGEAALSYELQGDALSTAAEDSGDWTSAADAYATAAATYDTAGQPSAAAAARRMQAEAVAELDGADAELEAATLYGQAAQGFLGVGDEEAAAHALGEQAYCMWPNQRDPYPHQSWDETRRLYGEAATLAQRAGVAGDQGDYLARLARTWKLDNDPDGDWLRAAELFDQAYVAYAKARDRKDDAAYALYQQADCYDEVPDCARASELYARAAQAYGQAGSEENQAYALQQQAHCVRPRDPRQAHHSYARAAELYGQALTLFEQVEDSDPRNALSSLVGKATCLRPDRDEERTDWETPATLFIQGASLARTCDDAWYLAACLLDAVQCQREGRRGAPTTVEQDAMLREALTALGDDGDADLRGEVRAWLWPPSEEGAEAEPSEEGVEAESSEEGVEVESPGD